MLEQLFEHGSSKGRLLCTCSIAEKTSPIIFLVICAILNAQGITQPTSCKPSYFLRSYFLTNPISQIPFSF